MVVHVAQVFCRRGCGQLAQLVEQRGIRGLRKPAGTRLERIVDLALVVARRTPAGGRGADRGIGVQRIVDGSPAAAITAAASTAGRGRVGQGEVSDALSGHTVQGTQGGIDPGCILDDLVRPGGFPVVLGHIDPLLALALGHCPQIRGQAARGGAQQISRLVGVLGLGHVVGVEVPLRCLVVVA